MVSCDLVVGDQQTPIIGEYLPPSILDHPPDLEEAPKNFLGRYPIVLGDLNTDIDRLRNSHDQQVSDFLASFGLVDFLAYFRQ